MHSNDSINCSALLALETSTFSWIKTDGYFVVLYTDLYNVQYGDCKGKEVKQTSSKIMKLSAA